MAFFGGNVQAISRRDAAMQRCSGSIAASGFINPLFISLSA
jgi:hypothetical protein